MRPLYIYTQRQKHIIDKIELQRGNQDHIRSGIVGHTGTSILHYFFVSKFFFHFNSKTRLIPS